MNYLCDLSSQLSISIVPQCLEMEMVDLRWQENVCSISASLVYSREEEGDIPIRRYQPFHPGPGLA